MIDIIISRFFSISIELLILTILAYVFIKTLKIKSAKMQSMIWLVVLMKPVFSLFIGAPVNLITFRQPAFVSYRINMVNQNAEILQAIDESMSQNDSIKNSNSIKSNTSMSSVSSGQNNPSQSGNSNNVKTSGDNQLNTKHVKKSILSYFPSIPIKALLFLIWLTGLYVFAQRYITNYFAMRKIIENSSLPHNEHFRAISEEVRSMLGLPIAPKVRVSADVKSPSILGLISPIIVIPMWLDEEENSDRLRWSLAHEFNHYKSKDHFSLMIRNLSAMLFYFHPCIWIASNMWEEAMEQACDRGLIKNDYDAKEYAGSLFEILKIVKEEKKMKFANGLFATRTQIGRRIANLLGGAVKTPAKISSFILSLFIVVSLTLLLTGFQVAQSADKTPEKKSAQTPQKTAPAVAEKSAPPPQPTITPAAVTPVPAQVAASTNTFLIESEKAKVIIQLYAFVTGKIPDNFEEIKNSGIFDGVDEALNENFEWKKTTASNEIHLIFKDPKSGEAITIPATIYTDWTQMQNTNCFSDDKYLDESKKFGEDNSIYLATLAGRSFSALTYTSNNPHFTDFSVYAKNMKDLLNNYEYDLSKNTEPKIRIYLEVLKPTFELYHQARMSDNVKYPESYTYHTPVPNFLSVQTASKMMVHNVLDLMRKNKYDEALQQCLDILYLGWRFRTEKSPLINNLIGIAVESIALKPINFLVHSGKLNKEQLQEIYDTIQRIDDAEIDIGKMLFSAENKFIIDSLKHLAEGTLVFQNGQIKSPTETGDESGGISGFFYKTYKSMTDPYPPRKFRNNMKLYTQQINDLYSYAIESYNLPYEQLLLEKRDQKMKEMIEKSTNPIIKYCMPNLSEMMIRMHVVKAKRRIVASAIMFEMKKIENGKYPESGGGIRPIPDEISTEPKLGLDNFFIKDNLLYSSDGNEYLIYSRGPDLSDNKAELLYDPTNGTLSSGDIYYK